MFEFGSETLAVEDTAFRDQGAQISGGGNIMWAFFTVPAGQALELYHIYASDDTSAITGILLSIDHSALLHPINYVVNPPAHSPATWTGKMWLREGDRIMIIFYGTFAADLLMTSAFGKVVTRR